MANTTIQVKSRNIEQLKNIQEKEYGTTNVPYYATLDVLLRDKLDELNNEDEE